MTASPAIVAATTRAMSSIAGARTPAITRQNPPAIRRAIRAAATPTAAPTGASPAARRAYNPRQAGTKHRQTGTAHDAEVGKAGLDRYGDPRDGCGRRHGEQPGCRRHREGHPQRLWHAT